MREILAQDFTHIPDLMAGAPGAAHHLMRRVRTGDIIPIGMLVLFILADGALQRLSFAVMTKALYLEKHQSTCVKLGDFIAS